MATNDGGPAFPNEGFQEPENLPQNGMSLRDYMAAKAMQAMVANPETDTGANSVENAAKMISAWAYVIADAMLSAREDKP